MYLLLLLQLFPFINAFEFAFAFVTVCVTVSMRQLLLFVLQLLMTDLCAVVDTVAVAAVVVVDGEDDCVDAVPADGSLRL